MEKYMERDGKKMEHRWNIDGTNRETTYETVEFRMDLLVIVVDIYGEMSRGWHHLVCKTGENTCEKLVIGNRVDH